jgi:uncharacterized membrane protein (DUF4010 family)
MLIAGILTASAVMMVRVRLVVSVLNRSVAEFLIFPILAGVLVQTVGALVLAFRKPGQKAPLLKLSNSLEVGTAPKLALFMAAVPLGGKLLQHVVASVGLLALAAASGMADVDAATVPITKMNVNEISPLLAAWALGLAVAVNTLSKAVMSLYLDPMERSIALCGRGWPRQQPSYLRWRCNVPPAHPTELVSSKPYRRRSWRSGRRRE